MICDAVTADPLTPGPTWPALSPAQHSGTTVTQVAAGWLEHSSTPTLSIDDRASSFGIILSCRAGGATSESISVTRRIGALGDTKVGPQTQSREVLPA